MPCALCSENANLYIKACDCPKKSLTHGPLTSEGIAKSNLKEVSKEASSKKDSTYETAKSAIYHIVRVYESTPPRTMKLLALISCLILFFAVFSLVLAQRDEAAQSKYGLAFPIDEAASNKAEKRVAASLTVSSAAVASPASGIPGESSGTDATRDAPTTQASSGDETKVISGSSLEQEGGNKPESESTSPANDDEERGEAADRNPRIVFIERLMGLHVSAPIRQGDGSQASGEEKEPLAENGPNNESKNPLDKLNAKWASRMRKFSIPLPSAVTDGQPQGPLADQPNPMLRYAAAAMMSRLVAAAARAQMEAQAQEAMNNHQVSAREGKDKDEEGEDETVPVIVATMRDESERGSNASPIRPHGLPPMYGRPMTPRGPIMRGPPNGIPFHTHQPINAGQHSGRHIQSMSMQQRAYIAPPPPPPPKQQQPIFQTRAGPILAGPSMGIMQRRTSQPVLVMLAVPMQSAAAESRPTISQIQMAPEMSAATSNVIHFPTPSAQRASAHGPFYPAVPYTYARPHFSSATAASYAVPVHMPVPVVPSYYQRQVYHYPVQVAYTHRADLQRSAASSPVVRPVIEVPVEVPVPYHVPIAMRSSAPAQVAYAHHPAENEPSPSDHDQLVLLYDAELHHGGEGGEDLEPSASDASGFHPINGQATPFAVTRPLPQVLTPNKMKLWRELANVKQSLQPGVRFMPVAVASEGNGENEQPAVHYPQPAPPTVDRRAEESVHPPALIVLAEQEDH